MPYNYKHLFQKPSPFERLAQIKAMSDPAEMRRALDQLKADMAKPASPEFIAEVIAEFYDALLARNVEHSRNAILPRRYPEAILTEAVKRLMKPGADWPSPPQIIATCEAVIAEKGRI